MSAGFCIDVTETLTHTIKETVDQLVDEISSSRASFPTWSGARGLLALDDPGCDLRS